MITYRVELPTYEVNEPLIFHFNDYGKATQFIKILIDNKHSATIMQEDTDELAF